MNKPTIAIVGASPDRGKFGNKAVRAYAQHGYEVYPIHPRAATIEGLQVYRSILDVPRPELDRVSVYLPPEIGLQVIEEIARKPAREVWLNPGAESPALVARARELGVNVVLGCSIVAIGVNPHDLDE
jgi:predicted CoA-binding protein